MKIKMITTIASWKNYRNLEAGKVYDMPPGDAQKLIQGGQAAEVIEEFLGEGARKRIEAEAKKPSLADFLPEEGKTPVGPPKPGKKEPGELAPPPAEKVPPEKKKVEIDPELSTWLVGRGFARGPEGVAYAKHDKVGEDTVKLQIDFSDTPKGTRYGYRLDLSKDPPEWKSDTALHDHPLLLQFKRFRDDLLGQRERAKTTPPGAKPEAPAEGGTRVEVMATGDEIPREREIMEIQLRDEQQILEEMKGKVLDAYFYQFKLRGRIVTGLSYAGCRALAQRMGGLRISDLQIKETEKAWVVTCKIHDVKRNLVLVGAAMQPKKMRLRDGSEIEDPFSFTKAVGKCQRNAIRACLPEQVITTMYNEWKAKQRGGAGGYTSGEWR